LAGGDELDRYHEALGDGEEDRYHRALIEPDGGEEAMDDISHRQIHEARTSPLILHLTTMIGILFLLNFSELGINC
jgi:hypothetical protein